MGETRNYDVLGIHDGEVARVRMFIGDQAIDEDLSLPRIITVEEQLEEAVNKRIAELQNNVSPEKSNLVVGDGDQVVNEEFFMPDDVEAANV